MRVVGETRQNLTCAICGDKADGQHFGADACRACAAFFRRTIAGKLKYVCRFEDGCEINKTYRCMCRSCRLSKCIRVGMNPNAVQAIRAPIKPYIRRDDHRASTSSNRSSDGELTDPATPIDVTTYQGNDVSSSCSGNSPDSGFGSLPKIESLSMSLCSPLPPVQKKPLHEIVEASAPEYIVDSSSLPPSHPILTQMLFGYQRLLDRRDECFSRPGPEWAENDAPRRTFLQQNVLCVTDYVHMLRTEVEWISEMLSTFNGYRDLPTNEKVTIFKHFWMHFVIFERTFESFRVMGGEQDDHRMAMPNGDVYDVISGSYDLTGVTDLPIEQVRPSCIPWFAIAAKEMLPAVKALQPTDMEMIFAIGYIICQPWYKIAALNMLPPMKVLQPTDMEMIFAIGYMLWSVKEIESKLQPETITFAENMRDILYDEIFAYYHTELQQCNYVKRMGDLVRLIGQTEKIVAHRNEDVMLNKIFNWAKVDVFLTDVFESD
uniref:Uncharacterized protein n=1 Tax=Acrobeloides nanus TaxID=290746 RepID=A0A914CK45_9BILA